MNEKLDRRELWATSTGWKLHLSPNCCGGSGQRKQVKDHAAPEFFTNGPEFELCRAAKAADQ